MITAGGLVIAGLTNNPAFPSPPVDLQAVQTAIDELNAALAAQAHAAEAALAERNSKQEVLFQLLRRLKYYVQDNCGNDRAVLLSSGFPAGAYTGNRTPLGSPAILSIEPANSGDLVLKVTRIARARCYEVRLAAMANGVVSGPWQAGGLFTDSRSMRISGLTPGMTYTFQARGIGGSTGYSDWSNPVSRIAA
jgi:hypothetical protein